MIDPDALYAELVAVFRRGDWSKSMALVEQLLPVAQQHAGVFGIAGVASLELEQLPQATDYLQKATTLDPARADFATLHAKALSRRRMSGDALAAADRAMHLAAGDASTLDTLGVIYSQNQALERAVDAFRDAAALEPKRAVYRLNFANALISNGAFGAAENELEACIALNPALWSAHLALARLSRQTAGSNHLERLSGLLHQYGNDPRASLLLNMAIAKEHEDLGDDSLAFAHLVEGKRAGRAMRPYVRTRDEALFKSLMRLFPVRRSVQKAGCQTTEPIFVMGMPRTGTTLVERILSSHPQVYAAGELQNFSLALQAEAGRDKPVLFDPDIFARMHSIDWARLGAAYLESTRPATAGKPHFIDKLPHNFLYAGFIARALPNAKIICLRRHPMDTCLTNFRHLFEHSSSHLDYSFDLLDTGRYFVLFDRLMAHWRDAFPGRILEVQYETLVAEQESCTRRMLEFCGLPWDDVCLHFEHNATPVSTASAAQVRAPIYRTAVGRWKRYERELEPLKRLLLDAGVGFDAL